MWSRGTTTIKINTKPILKNISTSFEIDPYPIKNIININKY
jgi:hypothetical protein